MSPDDYLTAGDIVKQYGLSPTVARSLVKNLSRRGLAQRWSGFRRVVVQRKYVEPKQVAS